MDELKNKALTAIKKHIYFVFMLLFFLSVYVFTSFSGNPKNGHQDHLLTADTLIPKGYTLVPVELTNKEAISGLIDGFGVVDIYETNKKLLNKVKILRAPLNPEEYAVLIPDRIASDFKKHLGPFTATVQNKASASIASEIQEKPIQRKTIKIEYNGG